LGMQQGQQQQGEQIGGIQRGDDVALIRVRRLIE
jgi:hypothetical protein